MTRVFRKAIISSKKRREVNYFKMKKTLLIVVVGLIVIGATFYFLSPVNDIGEENQLYAELVNCLAERGVIVYGSKTCPACIDFADQFGGYEAIEPIYVECSEDPEKCEQEMQGNYVPEIQIDGQLYTGPRSPEALARVTGCEI